MYMEGKGTISRFIRYLLCCIKYYFMGCRSQNVDVIFSESTPPILGATAAMIKKKLKVDVYKRQVSYYSTVALQAINNALYMGFNEIYILGLDFEPGVFKHFVDLGVKNGDPSKMSDKDEVCGRHWQYTKAQYRCV